MFSLFKGQTSLVFTAKSNEGPQHADFSKIRVQYGKECQLYWENGKCNGIDAGRCGVTLNGELYAWCVLPAQNLQQHDRFSGYLS